MQCKESTQQWCQGRLYMIACLHELTSFAVVQPWTCPLPSNDTLITPLVRDTPPAGAVRDVREHATLQIIQA